MSNWSHVCGVIRIDSIRFIMEEPNFDELIGYECLFDSDSDIWDDYENNPTKYLPMGSEGSLQKSVWVNPKDSSMAAYTVTIFGDLRDCDNNDYIIDWFKNKITEISKNYMIRQAVISCENERNGIDTYTWEDKEC